MTDISDVRFRSTGFFAMAGFWRQFGLHDADLSESDWARRLKGCYDRDGDRSVGDRGDERWTPEHGLGFGHAPERVATDLLQQAIRYGAYGEKPEFLLPEHWLSSLNDRRDEARLIDSKMAYLADPADFNLNTLVRRRQEGERDPKPRVRIHAEITGKGNLSVRLEPARDKLLEPDLLLRCDWTDPHSGFFKRPWQEALFIRDYESFARWGRENGTGSTALGRGMLCVFTLRCFQYVVYKARQVFEVSFADVLCLETGNAPVPTLRIVPYADLVEERRIEAEAYRLSDLARWVETLNGSPRSILDAVEAARGRNATKKALMAIIRAGGIPATYNSMERKIDRLQEAVAAFGDGEVERSISSSKSGEGSWSNTDAATADARPDLTPDRSGFPRPPIRPSQTERRFDERFARINELRAAKGWNSLRPIVRGFKSEELLRKLAAQSGVELPP